MSDLNDEYKKGYRDGYRDGLADAAKIVPKDKTPPYPQMPATPLPPPTYPYQPDNPGRLNISPRCPVCQIDWSGPMWYVCPRNDCPTKVWCVNDAGNGFVGRIN